MFEYHGWAVLRYDAFKTGEKPQRRLVDEFLKYASTIATGTNIMHADGTTEPEMATEHFSLRQCNGSNHFVITGSHNHARSYPLSIFRWLAANGLGSYGMLYVLDDESDEPETFKVFCLKRGRLDEHRDSLLSPTIPTIEDPYNPDRPDE